MSTTPFKMRLSREALLKAVAQVVSEQSQGLAASLECIGISAILVDQRKGGVDEAFPLDTVEVQLRRTDAAKVAQSAADMAGSHTAPPRHNKIRLAAVDGERL